MILSAIAIGSNSTRMLTADWVNGQLHPLARGREETKLFIGLDRNGMIPKEKLKNTVQAIKRLQFQAVCSGAEKCFLYATSATRDAKNSAEFIRQILEETGLQLQIISGTEEARLAFVATAGKKRCLVLDIGGGSTEFSVGENSQIEYSVSIQMGASRFLALHPINSLEDAQSVCALAAEKMDAACQHISALSPVTEWIGVGGTCTTSAAMSLGCEAHGEQVEGIILTKDSILEQLQLLARTPLNERAFIPGLPAGRVSIMPHGLCILLTAMEKLHATQIRVSGKTNLDGYLSEKFES